ncbi:hypothetical protein ACFQ0B_45145 [Nonomuraea thailandensis]
MVAKLVASWAGTAVPANTAGKPAIPVMTRNCDSRLRIRILL